jgi:hypothetical protein
MSACKPFKPKPVRRKIYLWKKADIYKIKEDLESFGNIGKRDIESLWHALKDAISIFPLCSCYHFVGTPFCFSMGQLQSILDPCS